MRYIIVNYHYIRPEPVPGFNPCTIDTFERQIGQLAKTHELVSLSGLWDAVQGQSKGNFCALTFDDGTKEHYEAVFPRLERIGAKGTFFPMGLPLKEKKVPLVHRLHVVLSQMPVPDIVDRFHSFFAGKYRIDDTVRLNPKRRFDDVLTSNLKETLITLPWDERAAFVEHVFRECVSSEEELTAHLFMNASEIVSLHRAGMEIGGHGYLHLSYEAADVAAQEQDIARGQEALKEVLGRLPSVFSYPHGRCTEDTRSILRDNGVSLACILGARDVEKEDDPLMIPRFDTNDFNQVMSSIN